MRRVYFQDRRRPVSGVLLPVPPGDPDALDSYASTLASAAEQIDALASSTVRVTADIKSNANWTGSAAEGYSAFTGSLAHSVGGTVPDLNRIASAVRDYAGCLRTAQEKVTAYNKAAEAASCLIPTKQPAAFAALDGPRNDAEAAVTAADTAGDIAAADIQGSATIQSVYLQQQVHLLDQQAPRPRPWWSAPVSRGPQWEAAPPDSRQLAAAAAHQAQERQAFISGDGLPPDPHTPEDLPPSGPDNWDDKNIPYYPSEEDAAP
jgi:uncharacterized protein YukE